LDTLEGRQIIVRRHSKITFTTLDAVERQLDDQILMIADGQRRSVGIAGVMGGLNSEISDTTTNILLESAYFLPSSIRKPPKIRAKYRGKLSFERNIDLLTVDYALRRATKLIIDLQEAKPRRDY
jgi:phenylalanyl-tRNA synthetase beta chain